MGIDEDFGEDILVKVISVKGKCEYGHHKGHKFPHPFLGLCPYAQHTLWPYITAKRFGGKIPWEKNNKLKISCPNPDDLVVFELSIK
ncbi:MAG: TIGR04076 family protein [Candidatus Woesearchaeota archaeon]|jgi:uncharacterized repeat protein (TIGR04076 family)|nr:TIGR04076 family protein [Candidatus Woesearchaeota archaeon]MDP7458448.1 TIGR04076 family protein [Candidatus Woesearchaeota archaeon]